MEMVFVIQSINTFSNIMYDIMDAEYVVSCLFFIGSLIVLAFWLLNLVVAVVTTSFQVIREENQRSAFAAKELQGNLRLQTSLNYSMSALRKIYEHTYILWTILIVFDLVVQALKTADMSQQGLRFLCEYSKECSVLKLSALTESIMTGVFAVEIVIRLAAYFPRWRSFFRSKRNCIDLGLAIATCIIQLPVIHNSDVYGWLTIFQILRVYRVILEIPITRKLLSRVLGNVWGLVNLVFFVSLSPLFSSLLAVQLLRGDIPFYNEDGSFNIISFRSTWNSFLGMYQILSTENWTVNLYNATSYQSIYSVGWISAIFFILWFCYCQQHCIESLHCCYSRRFRCI